MNLIEGFYYFIYWNIFLLISFHRVDAFQKLIIHSQKIADSVPTINAETNAAQRAERDYTWSYENDPEESSKRFISAWNFVSKLCIYLLISLTK